MLLASPESAPTSTLAGLNIRPFERSDADYTAVAEITSAVSPDYADTVEELRHADRTRPERIKHQRYLATLDGMTVGTASYGQSSGMYHPQKFFGFMAVLPAHQGYGIGKALYRHLLAELAAHDPISLRVYLREDWLRSVRFARERGFVEDGRNWESWLDVAAFDPAPYAGHEQKVLAQGLEIVTLAELIASDPEHRRKLYELDVDATRDEPLPEPFTPPGQADYDRWVFDNPNLRPDGFFIAVDNGRYAGLSSLFTSQTNPEALSVGFTGVSRDYRRRGIALALKLRSIAYARSVGAKTIKTGNDSTNRPMLSINEALGFVKQPAWLNLRKQFQEA